LGDGHHPIGIQGGLKVLRSGIEANNNLVACFDTQLQVTWNSWPTYERGKHRLQIVVEDTEITADNRGETGECSCESSYCGSNAGVDLIPVRSDIGLRLGVAFRMKEFPSQDDWNQPVRYLLLLLQAISNHACQIVEGVPLLVEVQRWPQHVQAAA
jgi:hypothetical protein